jgi:hypothetical protein
MVSLKDTLYLGELMEDFSPTYIITPYIIAKVNELIDEDSNWWKESASFCGMAICPNNKKIKWCELVPKMGNFQSKVLNISKKEDALIHKLLQICGSRYGRVRVRG